MVLSPAKARPHDPTPDRTAFYARVAEDEAARTVTLDHYIPRETGFAFPITQIKCCA